MSFQINRLNIAFEKLSISPDLILYGGSDLDVASLYRETEQAMQLLRNSIAESQQELETKQQELDENRRVLSGQRQNLQEMESRLKALTSQFQNNQRLLEQQQDELAKASENFRLADAQYSAARVEASRLLLEAENDVQQQMAILADLERQISEKNSLLAEREAALRSQSEELLEKTETVEQQAQVIDTQYLIIIVSALTLIVFAILAIIVARLYLKNKAITQELSDTVLRLKETQSQLVESEKLASLGQMVTGGAHEINTPIGVVVTSSSKIGADAELFLKKVKDQTLKRSEMENFLSVLVETDQMIQRNLERCARLIQNFKQVSADQIVAENRDINLCEYIDDVMHTLSVVLKQNRVEWSVTGDNPPQHIDPGLLGQVVNNLVNNAITHGFTDVEGRQFHVEISHREDYDEITFIDNGVGMDEETQEKMFDPFFTTKRGTGGTGLGMNIVYNIVTTKLNGTIAVESGIEEGTKIKITLPSASQAETGTTKLVS